MAITANQDEGVVRDVVQAGPDHVGKHEDEEEAMGTSMKDDKSVTDDVIANAEPPVIAPDQFNPRYEAKRKEIWSYYSYGVANNGLGLFNFANVLWVSGRRLKLMSKATPRAGPGVSPETPSGRLGPLLPRT